MCKSSLTGCSLRFIVGGVTTFLNLTPLCLCRNLDKVIDKHQLFTNSDIMILKHTSTSYLIMY